ncbi:MAG: class I SAM-dependent methyltransferase [Candidatus Asgardarchaeum sp.]
MEGKRISQSPTNNIPDESFADEEEERLFYRFFKDVSWRIINEYIPKRKKKILEINDKHGMWFIDLARQKHKITLIVRGNRNFKYASLLVSKNEMEKYVEVLNIDFSDITKMIEDRFDIIIADGDTISTYQKYRELIKDLVSLLKKNGILIACFENRYYNIKKFIPNLNLELLRTFLKTGDIYYIGKENELIFLYHAFTPEEIFDYFKELGLKVLKIAGRLVLPWRIIKKYLKKSDNYQLLVDIECELNEIPYLFSSSKQLIFIARKEQK